MIVRRRDASFVAAFSARGATREGILEAAKEDRQEFVRAHTNPPSLEATIVAPVKEGTANHGGRDREPLSLLMRSKEDEHHELRRSGGVG